MFTITQIAGNLFLEYMRKSGFVMWDQAGLLGQEGSRLMCNLVRRGKRRGGLRPPLNGVGFSLSP